MASEESIWERFSSSDNLIKIIFVILLSVLLLKPVLWLVGIFYAPAASVRLSWVLFYIIISAVILTIYILIFQRFKLARSDVFILLISLMAAIIILWQFNNFVPSNFAIQDILAGKEAIMSAVGFGG